MTFSKKFVIAFLLFVAVLLCVGAILLLVFSSFLTAYEPSLSDNFVRDWMDGIDEDAWCELFCEDVSDRVGAYETPEQAARYLTDVFVKDRDVYYVLQTDGTEKTYTVYSGRYPLALLTLEPNQALGFGFYDWKIKSLSVVRETVDLLFCDVSVTAPLDATVVCNGITLTDGSTILSPKVTIWEQKTDYALYVNEYNLGKMWSSPAVTVDGKSIDADKSGNFIGYDFAETHTVTVTVPKGASVYFNDILVAERYITEEKPLTGYLVFDGQSYSTVTYSVDGLVGTPEISVVYQDEFLTSGGLGYYAYPYQSYEIYVPKGFTLTVNGSHVTSTPVSAQPTLWSEAYGKLRNAVQYEKYVFNRVVGEAEFAVNGLIEQNGIFLLPADNVSRVLAESGAVDFIRQFLSFVCLTTSADTLKSMTLYKSQAYTAIEKSAGGVLYNAGYEQTSFTADVSDLCYYADNGYLCTVHYDANLKKLPGYSNKYPQTKTMSGSYKLGLIIENGKPYVFSMEAVTE